MSVRASGSRSLPASSASPPVGVAAPLADSASVPHRLLTWCSLLLIAPALTWRPSAAPGHGPWRLVHIAAAIGRLPVTLRTAARPSGLFVALGLLPVAPRCRLSALSGRASGFGVLALWPQLAFLVPAALLSAEGGEPSGAARWRSDYSRSLRRSPSVRAASRRTRPGRTWLPACPGTGSSTLALLVGSLAVTRVIRAGIAPGGRSFSRTGCAAEDMSGSLIPALVGGLLASPYPPPGRPCDARAGRLALFANLGPSAVDMGVHVRCRHRGGGLCRSGGRCRLIVGEVGALIFPSVAASKHLEPDGGNLAGDGPPAARYTS